MPYSYHTYRIRIANRRHVQVEARNGENDLVDEPSGTLSFDEKTQARLAELQLAALENRLSEQDIEEFGELLFDVLFDGGLRHDFFTRYHNARDAGALFRIELDVDEKELPEFAALPWEFLRAPAESGYGTSWLSTDPNLIFSRRRAQWKAAAPIRLESREALRIAVAIAAPSDLGVVKYEKLLVQLRRLSQNERIEILDPVTPATRSGIDEILRREPHIFHILAHARFLDEEARERGQIALVNAAGLAEWVEADVFSDLFKRHAPGVVLLHACESGASSPANAFVGLASNVVRQNVPVIAAMQYKVSNMTATRFALEFYRSLANGEPVDKAMQEGRRRIATGPHSYKTRDFATPILFMRVRDGHLFQRQAGSLSETDVQKLKAEAEELRKSQKFDEAAKRWKDIRDFGPDDNEAESKIMELQQQKLTHLYAEARKLERNQAYPNAISVWQEIALFASETQNAEREIERLQEQQQQHGSIRDIQQQLMLRMDEITPIYFALAKRLKQIQKEGIDDDSEILVGMVRQFLVKNLAAENLIEMWQGAAKTPSVKKDVIEYSALVGRLQRGEIIPVLGAEVHYHSGLLPFSAKDMVRQLAQEAKYIGFTGPLSMISQYYQMTEYGRNTLLQNVQEAIAPVLKKPRPLPLYDFFASIPQPI